MLFVGIIRKKNYVQLCLIIQFSNHYYFNSLLIIQFAYLQLFIQRAAVVAKSTKTAKELYFILDTQ